MRRPTRYVVTGLSGQLALSLSDLARGCENLEVIRLGRPQFDLTDIGTIARTVEAAEPDIIVSAAAYTAVDQAEQAAETAFAVNAAGAGELARAASILGVPIIHVSTDYVFDGGKSAPYTETDPVAPLGIYGRSKLEGERQVAATTENHVILRTAWVYSPFGKNFLRTMLKLAATQPELRIVEDQVGNPTSALDLADALLRVGQNLLTADDPSLRGVFHIAGSGEASWAEFAREIFKVSAQNGGSAADVIGISASAYPTPARRPANSRLDCRKLATLHNIVMPDWRSSTAHVVGRLLQPEGSSHNAIRELIS
ncbi:dTDP-4-dehydrorhamnose reductase [Neorhizobium alkalisoli]|uniref:dTDP-4-dehydrorhamnose reductase n=1 Tax=Neorhizobium alkalisoli TaxID=528178 RepID=UPI000CF8A7B2|nr:dTDP-4-dehydrorhamnose reductase [Neorhizobium alkalisoli]